MICDSKSSFSSLFWLQRCNNFSFYEQLFAVIFKNINTLNNIKKIMKRNVSNGKNCWLSIMIFCIYSYEIQTHAILCLEIFLFNFDIKHSFETWVMVWFVIMFIQPRCIFGNTMNANWNREIENQIRCMTLLFYES